MSKRTLSERDVSTKSITPALRNAGWDKMLQIREEVSFTEGRIIVRGKLVSRGQGKRADYILYHKPNLPIAIIEAKDRTHSVGKGIQQALDYAETARPLLQKIRHREAVTATRTASLPLLEKQGVAPREWLEAARSERHSSVLMLSVEDTEMEEAIDAEHHVSSE